MMCWPTSVSTAVLTKVIGDQNHASGRRVNLRERGFFPSLRFFE